MTSVVRQYSTSDTPVQPVGNQVQQETKTVQQETIRQDQQSVQLTQFTHQQKTFGVGVASFDIDFPVKFTAEPVFSHGMTLPGFAAMVGKEKTVEELRAAYEAAWKAYEPYSDPNNRALQELGNTEMIRALAKTYREAKAAYDAAVNTSSNPNQIPLASMYVKRWKLDDQNLFVGAEMIVVIRVPGSDDGGEVIVEPTDPGGVIS